MWERMCLEGVCAQCSEKNPERGEVMGGWRKLHIYGFGQP